MSRSIRSLMLAAGAACAVAVPVLAQANFSESFEGLDDGTEAAGGPPILVGRGWTFRNQSRPAGTGVSPYWTPFPSGWGQAGQPLGHGGFATWANDTSKISAWIILPAIPSQIAGDPLKVWTSAPTNAFGYNGASLEIRYSPSGGTSTGSNENDVGNFTTVLATISGADGHPWTERAVTLPGAGRVAFRYVLGPYSTNFEFSGSFLIDSLQVGAPPAPPYPLPSPGQTVHWTLAHSPVVIAQNAVGQNPRIVTGGTVIVDPGVEVRFNAGARLEVAGGIQLAGTASQKVKLRGPGSMVVLKGGLATCGFADVQSFTDLINGGRAAFADCAFSDPSLPTGFSYDSAGDIGHRVFDGNLDYARQVLSLERCTFAQGCEVAILRGWVAARDCTFDKGGWVSTGTGPIGGEAMYVTGGAILHNVTANDSSIQLLLNHDQHRYVGRVSVVGNPEGPGLLLAGGGNYLVDAAATLQNNRWPVAFGFNSAGLLPGSVLPKTGNQLNEIRDSDDSYPLDERTVWADTGIPYVVWPQSSIHGQVTILPGVTVKVTPNTQFSFDTDSNGYAQPVFLGEPERPIRFVPYTPGQRWSGVGIGNTRWYGTRWDWCVFEGASIAVSSAEMPIAFDNCVFRNNIHGVWHATLAALRKCTFENNIYSYSAEDFAPNHDVLGFLDANHPTNPNTFINNRGTPPPERYFGTFLPNGGLIARATHNSLEHTDSDARNNWWGTPTGPRHPTLNPSGQGDDVFFGLSAGGFLTPFLTQPPTANPPPVVRFVTGHVEPIPGEKFIVQWTARDDGSIVSQRVYYSPDANFDERMQLLATIPADARSFEWTAPAVGTPPNGADQFLRVVSVDNLGQEGIADLVIKITNPTPLAGQLIPVSPGAGTYRPGDSLQACATPIGPGGSLYAAIELDNDENGISLGGVFQNGGSACSVLPIQIPDVSTDRARVRFDTTGSLNQVKSFYGPYFSIRPDPLLGDAAPVVSITSAHAGQAYPGGGVVPITWTASDDEGLRTFDVRASFDGGTRWYVVARDLPAAIRAYDWRLPASTGHAQVRVRVVAKDLRFQNSSSESGVFAITPGTWPATCYANCDGSTAAPVLNVNDFTCFLNAFAAGESYANCDGSTTPPVLNVNDFVCFQTRYAAGCP
ncbi:MAG: choice-of-anchor J domain-containing protein [Phycisphaerae bacterium]|nr:choice-of-anchor J domain-containing protein [Phycisphaerae bacterium]